MAWGHGRLTQVEKRKYLLLSGVRVPRVPVYKYGGVVFSSGGGWQHHLAYMRNRTVSKTGELMGWARRNQVTTDLVARVWRIHVERAVLFGIGFILLGPTNQSELDAIQRKAARMLLGFSSRCPVPVVLAELGWTPWSEWLIGERVGLLRRLANTESAYCSWVLQASAAHESSWARTIANALNPWCTDGLPMSIAGWARLRQRCTADCTHHAIEDIRGKCLDHPRLHHYSQAMWRAQNKWDINSTLYNKRVPVQMARHVSRWFAGGQGLRGGDCSPTTCATPTNCCLHCMLMGIPVAESVHHVLMDCPLHQQRRAVAAGAGLLDGGCSSLLFHHRERWSWKQLRQIREYVVDVAVMRREAKQRGGPAAEQALANALWRQ